MKQDHKQASIETRRDVESYAAVAELIHDMSGALGNEFEKSPEGMEVKQLKAILAHITKMDDFIRFISGPKGQRGIDVQHAYLAGLKTEHDEKMLRRMQEISIKIEQKKMPDWHKWNYHYTMRTGLKDKITLNRDVHAFLAEFNRTLVDAMRYPETEVAKAIKEKKDIPNIIALENYEIIISIWKIFMKRLFKPFDQKQSAMKAPVERIDENRLIASIARKLKQDPEDVVKQIHAYFPNPVEDTNLSNIRALQSHLDTKTNILLKLLYDIGQKKDADAFIAMFGSPKKRMTPPTVALDIHNRFVEPLETESKKKEFEIKAVQDLGRHLEVTIKSMEKMLKGEHDYIRHLIEHRIKSLEHKFAKALEQLDKMEAETKKNSEECIFAAESAEEYHKELAGLNRKRAEIFDRALHITDVWSTQILLEKLRHGTIQQQDCDRQIADIVARTGSEVKQAILVMQDIYNKNMRNEISADEFATKMDSIKNSFIGPVTQQMKTVIPENLKITNKKRKAVAAKLEDMLNAMRFYVSGMKTKASHYAGKIKRLHIDIKHLALPQKDVEVLEGVK